MRAALSALALLAACSGQQTAEAPPPPSAEGAEPDTCGAAGFAQLIGTQADAIDRTALPPQARVIAPDTAVTMDYRAERLNVIVDKDGRVESLRCF